MRERFERQLMQLNTELIAMGALCEDAISCAAKYLAENDCAMKENALEAEKQIDRKEHEIESICMQLLIRQQPVAADLRTVSSALRMISDMERIGDQAADIAEIVNYVSGFGLKNETHIYDMAEATVKMVTDSVESFVKKDIALARSVIALDDTVDGLFLTVKNELINAVRQGSDNGEALIDLLMTAKYFERIGDHAENIAKWVIYAVTGLHSYMGEHTEEQLIFEE